MAGMQDLSLRAIVERFVDFRAGILAKEFDPNSPTLTELFDDAEAALRRDDDAVVGVSSVLPDGTLKEYHKG